MNLPKINNRSEITKLLHQFDLTNVGVEVGVHRGEFSNHILNTWDGEKLYSIDCYKHLDIDYEYIFNFTDEHFEYLYRTAKSELSKHGERSELVRMTSEEGSNLFDKKSLDFVYIDTLPDYNSISTDIDFWWDKIKCGGILCGSSYINTTHDGIEFGGKQAVDEFVSKHKLDSHLIVTDELFKSWFIIKPKNKIDIKKKIYFQKNKNNLVKRIQFFPYF